MSLAVSHSDLIASGEYGNKPAIHIWDSTTLQSINIIRSIHDNGVMFMEFIYNDQLLATCSWRKKAQVIVYNIHDSSIIFSSSTNGFAVDLLQISNYLVD